MNTIAQLAIAACVSFAPASGPEVPPVGSPFRLQPGDPVAAPIASERTPAEQQQLDALAWFGIGRMRESRGEFRQALEAYRRALELNPTQVAIYERLVPLEFSLEENESAIEHALRLIELTPDNVNLMHQLSQILVSRGQVRQAIRLLEKATSAQSLDRHSPQFLMLQHDRGQLYRAIGQNEKAAAAFELLLDGLKNPGKYHLSDRQRKALVSDPETTYEQLGQIFLSVEKVELAIEAFRQAADARQGQPGILQFNLARAYLAADQPDKALGQLDEYVDAGHTERGRAAYDLLKSVLSRLDRESEYVDRLREIVDRASDNAAARIVLADELFEQDKHDEAAKLYEAAVEIAPASASGLLGLARIARTRDRAGDILEYLARATVAHASDEAVGAELAAIADNSKLAEEVLAQERRRAEQTPPQTSFTSSRLAGMLAVEAEQLDQAEYFFQLAAGIRPDKKAAILGELGVAQMIAEQMPAAIATLREALEASTTDPERLDLMLRLAQALEFHHETDAALETIEKALDMAPEIPLLHFQRAWICFHAGQLDKAEELLLEVIEQFPQSPDVVRQTRLTLSALYVQQGDIQRGEDVLEAIYDDNPDDISVCNDLGYLYADQGKKLKQAEQMIRKAVAAEPDNAAYLDSLGWVLYQQERFEEAAKPLEKAVEQPLGDDATIWNHLGDVYEALGRHEDARKAWKTALDRARETKPVEEELVKKLEEKFTSKPAD